MRSIQPEEVVLYCEIQLPNIRKSDLTRVKMYLLWKLFRGWITMDRIAYLNNIKSPNYVSQAIQYVDKDKVLTKISDKMIDLIKRNLMQKP